MSPVKSALLLPLVLAACAGLESGPRTSQRSISTAYSLSELGYASGRGPIPVLAIGTPFADGAPLADAVAAAMPAHFVGGLRWQPVSVGPMPDEGRLSYRVVFRFDLPRAVPEDQICVSGPEPVPTRVPAAETMTVQAAFCRGSSALSAIVGQLPRVPDPRHPDFQALIGQMTLDLFPYRNPFTDDDRRFPRFLFGLSGSGGGGNGIHVRPGIGIGF